MKAISVCWGKVLVGGQMLLSLIKQNNCAAGREVIMGGSGKIDKGEYKGFSNTLWVFLIANGMHCTLFIFCLSTV